MYEDIQKILITREELAQMVKNLAETISQDYSGKQLVLVGVLKGGSVFLADLMREITVPLELDFISVSSYGSSTTSSGIVRIIKDVDIDIKNKHLLFVEDIVDTGLTINHLKELFLTREPASIKVCTAFDKPSRRKIDIKPEYMGIEIPDEFVVGYGLDYCEKYRNLPNVCILKTEVYNK